MRTPILKYIAIRVDASSRIGIGHVMRCLTLAKKLQQHNCQIFFLCKQHQGNLIAMIQQQGFIVIALSAPIENIETQTDDKKWLGCSYKQDAEEVMQALANIPWLDWLIVDHYSLDYRWQKLIKPLTNKIMVIDDLANRKHACDILLDQTLNREIKDYKTLVPKHCQLLLGKNFMLLREEFTQLRPLAKIKRVQTHVIHNILITMGGTDPDNITEKVINWLIPLKQINPSLAITAVVNPTSIHLPSLKILAHENKWITITVAPKSMAKLMLAADLGIGTAGTTAWERCCLGLPTLTIISAKNQKTIAKNLEESGAIFNLGDFNFLNRDTFVKHFLTLTNSLKTYRTMVENSFNCCNGKGVQRIISSLQIE